MIRETEHWFVRTPQEK